MPELRQLLRRAAGDPPDLPDFDAIQLRARPRILRRRVAAAVAAMALGLAGWAGTSSALRNLGSDSGDVAVDAPRPTSTAESLRVGLLEPGTYSTKVGSFDVVVETHDDSWGAAVVEPTWLALSYRQYMLHLQVWDGVAPPSADDGDGRQDPPADVAAWLETHPRLSTSPPAKVEIAGTTATQVDVRVIKPLASTPRECPSRCVILGNVAGADESVDLEVGQRARFLIFGPPGHELVVFYRSTEKEFAALDAAAQELLADLRLKASS